MIDNKEIEEFRKIKLPTYKYSAMSKNGLYPRVIKMLECSKMNFETELFYFQNKLRKCSNNKLERVLKIKISETLNKLNQVRDKLWEI